MSWLTSKGPGLLGAAAPFLPPPWNAVAGGAAGLLAGSENRKKEDQLLSIQRKIAENQAKIYEQYAAPAIESLSGTAGFSMGPGGKSVYNPDYNPNEASAGQFFDPKNLQSEMVGHREATDRGYDNAVNATYADSLGRGFTGRDSFRDSNVASIRREQAGGTARFDRGLLSDLENQRREYLMSGLEKRDAARGQLIGLGTGAGSSAFGNLDSLGGVYASRAGGAAQGVGQLANTAGAGNQGIGGDLTSVVDWIKRQAGGGRRTTQPTVPTNPFNYNSGFA